MPAPYDDGQPALWISLSTLTAQWVNLPPTGIFITGPPPPPPDETPPVDPPPPPAVHGSAWDDADPWDDNDSWSD